MVHFAGSVTYDVIGVLEKNRDTLPNGILYNMKSKSKQVYSIPLTQNSVQSHNSVQFLLFTCLTTLIKDSISLHSALVVKTYYVEKRVLNVNGTYLINDQNVNISPIQMQHGIFDHKNSKYLEKRYPVVGFWSCQQSNMTTPIVQIHS